MTDAENPDSFKFAITFLAAVGTILYAVYNYFQIKSIHISWFSYVMDFTTILLVSSFFIMAYILLKGITIEVKDPQKVIILNKIAKDVYIMAFLMGILFLVSPGINFISVRFQTSNPYKNIFTFFLVALITLLILPKFYKNWKKRCLTFFILFIIIFIVLEPPISVLFQGNININMDNIYSKNISTIPVSIELTGVNDELSIYLNKNYANNLTQIDNITLGPNHKDKNIYGDNLTLYGNGFYSGKYHIFINTTNMTEGYYELVISRSIDKWPYGKSFYLN